MTKSKTYHGTEINYDIQTINYDIKKFKCQNDGILRYNYDTLNHNFDYLLIITVTITTYVIYSFIFVVISTTQLPIFFLCVENDLS